MLKKFPVFISFVCFLSLLGCVGQNTYQKKVEETSDLNRDLAEVRKRNMDLTRENEGLRAESVELGRKIDQLEAGKKDLQELLVTKQDTPTRKIAEQGREIESLREDLANLQRGREGKVRDVSILYESLLERMKDEVAHGRASISELRGTVTVTVPEEIFFAEGSEQVKPDGVNAVRKVADLLNGARDRKVRVEATFDISSETETAGKQRLPWETAASRTVALAELFRRNGVDPAAINVAVNGGFGHVVASGAAAGRGKSRSFGIIIVSKE
jgi:flagellar motor protein MotB